MKALFHHVYDVKEENGRYRPVRFTDSQIDALRQLNEAFKTYASCASGVSLRFYTDAEELSFAYHATQTSSGPSGFDVYENGLLVHSELLGSYDGVFSYRKRAEEEVLFEIFLPSHVMIELYDFNLGSWRAAEPSGKKKILFLGDSITMNTYVSAPSISFLKLAADAVGADYLNCGVGSLYYEPSTLENINYDPDVIYCEFGANDLVKHDAKGQIVFKDGEVQWSDESDFPMLLGKAEGYIAKVRRLYPRAKVVMQSVLWVAANNPPSRNAVRLAYNEELRKLAEKLNVSFIDGERLVPHIPACFVEDGTHLTMLGNSMLAHGIIPYLAD